MSDKKSKEEKKKKIVRATDASILNRLRKKLGVKFLKDMTDKELQAVLDAPDSVFGKMKRQGKVGFERARRKDLTDKAYPDKILRDFTKVGGKYGDKVGKKAREARSRVDTALAEIRKKKKKNSGSNDMRKGGMVLSTVDNRKTK